MGKEGAGATGSVAEALAHEEHGRLKELRQEQVWYVGVGVAMLFASSFHWGIGAGGVLMILYGGARYLQISIKMHQVYDPWDDEEIDAWEQRQLAEEE